MRRPAAAGLLSLSLLALLLQPLLPADEAWAQGRSHQAPGRARGNPDPGGKQGHKKRDKGGDHDRGDHHRHDWQDWDANRWREYDRRPPYDHWSRPVVIQTTVYRPIWLQSSGWQRERPWRTGWYGSQTPRNWGWWAPQSALWGMGNLPTASLINQAVSQALTSSLPTIAVPSTPWRLVVGSLRPQGYDEVRFAVRRDGRTYEMAADCREGLLNGYVPSGYREAQLIHTACVVAYGGPGY